MDDIIAGLFRDRVPNGRPRPDSRAPRTQGTLVIDANPGGDIGDMRQRIDEIDQAFMSLWRERAHLSQLIGAARLAAGGTRLALGREQQVVRRFRDGIGTDGVQLALLLLRAGRGPL